MAKKQDGVGHVTTFAYPTGEQFQEALPVFLKKVRGDVVPANDIIHASYAVAGYALGAMYPHDGGLHSTAEMTALLGSAQMADLIDAAAPGTDVEDGVKGWADIPWKAILALAMRVIQELLVQVS